MRRTADSTSSATDSTRRTADSTSGATDSARRTADSTSSATDSAKKSISTARSPVLSTRRAAGSPRVSVDSLTITRSSAWACPLGTRIFVPWAWIEPSRPRISSLSSWGGCPSSTGGYLSPRHWLRPQWPSWSSRSRFHGDAARLSSLGFEAPWVLMETFLETDYGPALALERLWRSERRERRVDQRLQEKHHRRVHDVEPSQIPSARSDDLDL